MTENGPAILARLGAALLADFWFWLVLALALAAVATCSLACFEKRWLRALISGGLAVEAFWFLSGGWL